MAITGSANQANYRPDLRYAVTGTTTDLLSDSNQNVLTDVGTFTNSASYYGAFDMSGNVFDWNDLDNTAVASRGLRGGFWLNDAFNLSSSHRGTDGPSAETYYTGFRLVSPVPEPSTYAMALAGLACGGFSMWRRWKRA